MRRFGGFRGYVAVVAAATVGMMAPASAMAAPSGPVSAWVTLGTQGGPMSDANRSQPANLLLTDHGAYIVDAGDGTVQQLAKVGQSVQTIRAVFLSHLHFDHTGGLAALLGLRLQLRTQGKLVIYGPPGTHDLVAGLVASMQPAAAAGYGLSGQAFDDPSKTVEVIELADDQSFKLDGMTVTVRQNSHYSFPPGSEMDRRFKSLSFRFDLDDRAIAYTGDTGPSQAVAELAKGADLLVSEMIDEAATLAAVRRNAPNAPPAQISDIVAHLTLHHLTPQDVGAMATSAGVRSLVMTHIAGDHPGPDDIRRYVAGVRANYSGPVVVARDLDQF